MVFLWYLQKGVTLAKDNKEKRIGKKVKCCFCSSLETIQHLFFHYQFVRFVWNSVHFTPLLGTQQWTRRLPHPFFWRKRRMEKWWPSRLTSKPIGSGPNQFGCLRTSSQPWRSPKRFGSRRESEKSGRLQGILRLGKSLDTYCGVQQISWCHCQVGYWRQ